MSRQAIPNPPSTRCFLVPVDPAQHNAHVPSSAATPSPTRNGGAQSRTTRAPFYATVTYTALFPNIQFRLSGGLTLTRRVTITNTQHTLRNLKSLIRKRRGTANPRPLPSGQRLSVHAARAGPRKSRSGARPAARRASRGLPLRRRVSGCSCGSRRRAIDRRLRLRLTRVSREPCMYSFTIKCSYHQGFS